jgi:F0F1-type ATP synthase assembly protein I
VNLQVSFIVVCVCAHACANWVCEEGLKFVLGGYGFMLEVVVCSLFDKLAQLENFSVQ